MKSLIPRTSPGKSKPNKAMPPKSRSNGPVYLPKHIYNMLSEDIKKELDKYNQEKKAQYKSTHPRMPKVHEHVMMRLKPLTILNLTLRIISQMIHTTQILKTSWKHMVIIQPKWHLHITSQSILPLLMDP